MSENRPSDPAAFREGLLAVRRDVYRFALSLCRDPDAAEELVQEAFAKALARADQLLHLGQIRSWLFRIVHNLYLDHQRSKRARPTLVVLSGGTEPGKADLRDQVEARIELTELQAALETLAREQQTVLLLRDALGLTYAEIAQVLDCPVGTVRSRLSRARGALLERLSGKRSQGKVSNEPL